jgi:hypothetical protein
MTIEKPKHFREINIVKIIMLGRLRFRDLVRNMALRKLFDVIVLKRVGVI